VLSKSCVETDTWRDSECDLKVYFWSNIGRNCPGHLPQNHQLVMGVMVELGEVYFVLPWDNADGRKIMGDSCSRMKISASIGAVLRGRPYLHSRLRAK